MTKILAAWDAAFDSYAQEVLGELLAKRLIDGVKFGLETAALSAYSFTECLHWVRLRGGYVLADLKIFGTPETTRDAVRALARHADGITIAAPWGHDASLKAATEAAGGATLFGCAALTSLGEGESPSPWTSVLQAQRQAAYKFERLGIGGITIGCPELRTLREEVGFQACKRATLVLGIRPVWADWIANDDQKRTATPKEAVALCADFIAAGRALFGTKDYLTAAQNLHREVRDAGG